MIVLPATDIYGGQVVRLLHGDYSRMTVYDADALDAARRFEAAGAEWLHAVDLEGARDGGTPNIGSVRRVIEGTHLKVEIGGGIRDADTVARYIEAGVSRVILGTAAVTDTAFVCRCVAAYPGRVAVGADLRDGKVSIRGWTEDVPLTYREFINRMCDAGVRDFIVTDISRDGALRGTNIALYREICVACPDIRLVASGGVTDLSDIASLTEIDGVWGAIVGRAVYTGDIDLARAITVARGESGGGEC